LIHTFVGVYHGELEDPWWKEGMTNYLGYLLPLQAGRISDSAFASGIFPLIDTVPAVRDVPLASPEVRTRLFLPLDSAWAPPADPRGFINLVYGKGGEASMILDRWLLERSGGRKSVFDLVRSLIREHGPPLTAPNS
jgi:predicted metalloprotease with PDZ domain